MNDDVIRALLSRMGAVGMGAVDEGADDFMRALQAGRAARGIAPVIADEAGLGALEHPAMGGAMGGMGGAVGGAMQDREIEEMLYFITQLMELNKATQEQGMLPGSAQWAGGAMGGELASQMLLSSLGM
jgi:hypothetical protein